MKKKNRKLILRGTFLSMFFLLSLFFITVPAMAQQTVTGEVVTTDGEPIPGATVIIKGTSSGSITDAKGEFMLKAGQGDILVISFIGMKSQEVSFTGQSKINVILAPDVIGIEEVVAVGYGTVRKSDLTGSVSKIIVEDASERSVTSVEQLLQGQVSGVQITSNTGAPGSGMSFSIRGATSISGSNQPLIVIDGYPVDSDNSNVRVSQGGYSGYLDELPEDNALANLNPSEIESVEILKDASATAIYGSRASNGVVLITTKRGKTGDDRIEYSYRTDISKLPKTIEVLNTLDYLNYSNEAYLNSGAGSVYDASQIAEYSAINTNWQDLIYRTARSQDHQLRLSGGKDKMKYAVNIGYLGQEGIVKNTKFDRGSIRINLDREFSEKITFGVNMSAVVSKNKAVMQSSNRIDPSTSVVYGALRSRPFDYPYTIEDEIDQTQTGNPVTLIELADDQNRVTTILANMFLKYNIAKGLDFKVNGGINAGSSRRDFYHPRGVFLGNVRGGFAFYGEGNSFNYLSEYTLSYNNTLKKKHRINSVVGYTWQERTSRNFGVNVLGFPNDNLLYYDLSSGTMISNAKTATTQWGLASFLGRINYSFDNRYLLTFTGREDGSTRLADGNKWAFFPSVALGWNVHNEKFIKSSFDFVSQFKIRTSYGLSGNQAIAVGATKSMLNSTSSVVNQSIQMGYVLSNMANNTLHWEMTKQFNIGLDLALFNNRVTFGFDHYRKLTDGLLIALSIPPSNGFSSYNTNQGSIENEGFEFDLSGKILTKGLKWDISGNISFNRNKITDLGGVESFMGPSMNAVSNQSLHIAKVGYPIGAFYGYRITGIYQNQEEVDAGPVDPQNTAPGTFKYKDISGPDGVPDGAINAFDREIIGNPYPDYIFGITNNFNWKGFNLSVFVQGSIGQDVANVTRHNLDALTRGIATNVRKKAYDNRWTGEGTSNTYPQATTSASPFNDRFTDFVVEDASYVRIKNATLSYDFDMKKWRNLKNIRVFVSSSNFLTFTKYEGYDPEINSKAKNSLTPGVDTGSVPQYRSFSAGLNLRF